MKNKHVVTYVLLFTLVLSGCSVTKVSNEKPRAEAKNIIMLIGDGMGVSQLYAGMSISRQPFFLEKFPYAGLCKTFSSDNYVTDSAAGGTAIASGEKTNNGMIGVTPDGKPVSSIVEIAHNNGLSTGVVSTSSVTHATPASFVAHNAGRGNYEDIAADFLNGTIDLFIGGGENHFRTRKDGRDLTTDLKKAGYEVVYSMDELKKSNSPKIAGLLAKEHLPKVIEGRGAMLEEMTKKAIEILSRDEDGFFLMVEGSMIDWGAHDNNIEYTSTEVVDFDKAVGVALEFAGIDKETLVIVTADHETGGLSVTGGNMKENTVEANFAGKNHTGVLVPIFSIGPGAERFSGIHDNTFFFNEFLDLLKINKK